MVTAGWFLNFIGILIFTIFVFTIVLWAFGITLDLPSWALASTVTI
jgi:sodium-dependent dicarboxylate transporter 2/3/5